MKISTKGQVTIPQEFREELGLLPGAEVEFRLEGRELRLIPVREARARGRRIVAQLRGRGTVRMTTDEIMALTRGE